MVAERGPSIGHMLRLLPLVLAAALALGGCSLTLGTLAAVISDDPPAAGKDAPDPARTRFLVGFAVGLLVDIFAVVPLAEDISIPNGS